MSSNKAHHSMEKYSRKTRAPTLTTSRQHRTRAACQCSTARRENSDVEDKYRLAHGAHNTTKPLLRSLAGRWLKCINGLCFLFPVQFLPALKIWDILLILNLKMKWRRFAELMPAQDNTPARCLIKTRGCLQSLSRIPPSRFNRYFLLCHGLHISILGKGPMSNI